VKAAEAAPDPALRRAAGFVATRGDPLRSRAAAVLLGERPLAEAIHVFEAWQRGDGAFVTPEEPSPLAATLEILGLLDDLGALNEPLVERACAQLARIQRDDGSWSDGDAAAETAARVTTGTLAGILAKTRWVRALVARSRPALRLAAARGPRALLRERGPRARRRGPAVVRPRAGARLPSVAAAIRTAQAEDGGWPAPGDDPSVSRVVHSFDALVALGQLS
jgi:hypothetical protein